MNTVKDIPCLVLGIGNILWADEGFGVRAVEQFNSKYALTDVNNLVADGGTLGMYLFDRICRTEKLLVFDCCDFHGAPGELTVLRNDDIRIWTSTKISPHQDGMNDLLAAAMLRGCEPKEIAVVGFQPVLLDDYGGSLSQKAKDVIPQAVADGYHILREWDVGVRERSENETVPALMDAECLNIKNYEEGRPTPEEACREGDIRFAHLNLKRSE